MTQGVEFNRLMLDMRAMQADAMSLPKVGAGVRARAWAEQLCRYARPGHWQGE